MKAPEVQFVLVPHEGRGDQPERFADLESQIAGLKGLDKIRLARGAGSVLASAPVQNVRQGEAVGKALSDGLSGWSVSAASSYDAPKSL